MTAPDSPKNGKAVADACLLPAERPRPTLPGATNPLASPPGTVRADLAVNVGRNVIHGSDGPDGAKSEIPLWFKQGEIVDIDSTQWPHHVGLYLYDTKCATRNLPCRSRVTCSAFSAEPGGQSGAGGAISACTCTGICREAREIAVFLNHPPPLPSVWPLRQA